jgi:hypothetical protein
MSWKFTRRRLRIGLDGYGRCDGARGPRRRGRRAQDEVREHAQPVEDPAEVDDGEAGFAVEETAWNAAVEAAPWLLGEREPTDPIPARELFERLKPFQEEVAEDIRDGEGD